MRFAKFLAAACFIAANAAPAPAQIVEPLKVLEGERRDRLEMESRLAREAAARRQKEKADEAAQAEARRKLEQATATPPGTPTPAAAPDEPGRAPALPGQASAADSAKEAAPKTVVATPAPAPPAARVLISVDKGAQRMRVTVDGKLRHSWAVSTGRTRYETPTGTFRPFRLAREHYSKEWDDAPMPHSIFFTAGGHAIHGSNDTGRLGRRASHGCVRLAPSNAAALFALVQAEGPNATRVTITDGSGVKTARKAARSRTVDASPGRFDPVRRATPDSWLTGPGDSWFE